MWKGETQTTLWLDNSEWSVYVGDLKVWVDWKIIPKLILEKSLVRFSDSGFGLTAGFCDDGDEPPGYTLTGNS